MNEELKGQIVSSGTLRTEDLLATFTEKVAELMPDAGVIADCRNILRLINTFAESALMFPELDDLHYEAKMLVNEDLFELLNELAPEGYYFGAHEGDGALFGFWPDPEYEHFGEMLYH